MITLAVWIGYGVFCMLQPAAAAQTKSGPMADHLFVPNAWPKETGAPVNSSPVLGDIDGDGVLEIIVGSDNNKVYAWKPDGTLMPGWPVTTGDSVRSSPALADLDGDGRLDVIVGSFDNKVYAWNFNGSLLPGWPAVTGSVVYSSPAVGDLDGDQQPEVVVGSFDNKVYAWNADGTIVRGWPKPTGLFVYSSPALADINKDGMLEVIVGTDNNRVFAWKGDGADVEGWPTATEHVVPSSPAVGDIDNDGKLEVIVGSWDQVFVWNSQGERKAGWPVTAGHQIPSSPALADLNNDGKLEIIVGCKDGKVYAWDVSGRMLAGWPTITDAEISASPAVADLDGDGKLEVAMGSKDNKIYVWDAQGRLLPGWPKNTADMISSSPAIGDLDGNGTLELVIGSKDGKVYAWSFPRTGKGATTVVWQNFHGDPAHTGRYGAQPEGMRSEIARTAETQPTSPVQPVGETHPLPLPRGETPGIPSESQQPIIPREIKDGAVNDLSIANFDDNQVTLTWTSPLGFRTAQIAYEIRYATEPLTEETWNKAARYPETIRLAPAGTRETHTLTNLPAARKLYLAVKVTEGVKSLPLSNVVLLERPDTIPPAKIRGLKATELNETTIELAWQTTGDDGTDGTATTYDIRYSDAPLDELTWPRATQVANAPAPLPVGTEQTFQIPRPWNDREIFFGIKAIDKALNISALSDVAVWGPQDTIPPARIVDLHVAKISGNTVTIAWTAPGNNLNVGKAQHYDLRSADVPISEENWAVARPVENPPVPAESGTPQTYTLQGIPIGTVGYVGIKTIDRSGNVAPLSNVVKTALDDRTPPAAVADLKVEQIGKDAVRVSWTATGNNAQKGTAAAYVLRYGGNPQVIKSWTGAIDVQQLPIPSPSGTKETATIEGLNENTTYYIGLRALDDQGNSSETSNLVRVKTFGRSTPDAVTDLAIEEMKPGSVTLNWTAPRDVGEETPRVSGYDLRYALSEITEADWETATKVPSPPKPSEPGTLESFIVKGVPQNSAYYLALKSFDAVGNFSGLSNVPPVPQMDTTPPNPILDLFVDETGPDWAKISWTVPGEGKQDQVKIAGAAPAEGIQEKQVGSYLIRVAPTLKLVQQWDKATEIPTTELRPSTAGMKESFTITGLKDRATFYIAVKSADAFGNVSEISNVVRAKTKDAVPPAAISDLQVANIKSDTVTLKWTATGDDGNEGQAQVYDIRYAPDPITEENWGSTQMVPVVPRPAKAGIPETVTVTGLQPKTLYYFAVVATDASGNVSPLSNVVDVLTADTTPPPAITTLRVAKVADDSVALTWFSPGNDEYRDAPERYEIRYRQSAEGPLNEDTWSKSTPVPEPPIPSGKGEKEQFLLSGLQKNTLYAIGVKSLDEYGNLSEGSNIIQVYTAADNVTDLAILGFSGQSVTLSWTTPGGEIVEGKRYEIRYATTALTEENWANATPAKLVLPQDLMVKEFKKTEKVELTELPPYEKLFFAVRVAYPEPTEEGAERQFSGLSNVVELNRIDIIPPGDVTDLKVTDAGESNGQRSLQLSWTAPGDNEMEGTATKYDLRYGAVPPTEENWNTLTTVPDAPKPLSAGTPQQATVQITPGEDTVYFALKTFDEASNVSGLSNIAKWKPEDKISPAAITDVKVERVHGSDVTISWTAPGDNGNRGSAAFYDIRYATKEADVKDWDRAMVVADEPLPEVAGTHQEYTITGLQPRTMYYIAMKTTDDAKNTSDLSNIVAIQTGDIVPPAQIADLHLGKQGDDWVELLWTASGDDGNSGRATAYSLRYATAPDELKNWDQAYEVTNVPAPKDPGSQESFTVKNLRPNTQYYFAIRAIDSVGNMGEISNVAEILSADRESSEPITDLGFIGGTDTIVTLSWKAPRDRGPVAQLAKYEIRYSEDKKQLEQWNQAKKVNQAIVPGEPETPEKIVIEKLAPNKRYYVAVKAIDQKGNISDISNIAEASTTDTIPPKPVADLAVQAATENSVTLSWTVIEDDAAHDQPQVYEIRYRLDALNETNWEQAETAQPADVKMLQPSAPGIQMTYTIAKLTENTTYYFGICAIDASGNLSPLSNVVAAQTKDVTPPHAVNDLQAIFPTANSVMLSWTSPSDIPSGIQSAVSSPQSAVSDSELAIDAYDIRYTTTPPGNGVLDEQAWEKAEKVLAPPKPQSPGLVEEFVIRNLEPGKTYYFAMKAIDRSGNIATLSNTAVETTLPADVTPTLPAESDRQWSDARAIKPGSAGAGTRAWEILQGKDIGEIQKDSSGVATLTTKAGSRGLASAAAVITAVYPQSDQVMAVQQGTLTLQMKSPQRFGLYVKVHAETGEQYDLCYTPDFGIGSRAVAPAIPSTEGPGVGQVPETRLRKRIENYVFFPLDPALLDNQWHDVRINLAQDLLDGTGQVYAGTRQLTLRGNDFSFKAMKMSGPVFTKIDDFENLRNPLENGWKIHFGAGAVQVVKEPVLNNAARSGGERSALEGIKVGWKGPENAFLSVKTDSYRGMVLMYPKEGAGQLSDKPFFLVDVRAVGDFKMILKVATRDNREYYLAYLPEANLEQAGVSGNYLYLPLHVEFGQEGSAAGDWRPIQANIAQDLRNNGLDYAYTSWISFHGREFSLDNVRFSTDILETAIE